MRWLRASKPSSASTPSRLPFPSPSLCFSLNDLPPKLTEDGLQSALRGAESRGRGVVACCRCRAAAGT